MDKVFLKGLTVLETLAASEAPRGITDLANDLNLTKSNVHRLLQALVHRGYAEKDESSGRYQCTMRLWQLGSSLASRIEVRPVARPYMAKLVKQTQEAAHLSILDGTRILYIDKIDSPQPIGAHSTVGGHAPPHCVATGKAMLACLSDSEVRQRLASLPKFTSRTITDMGELLRELEKVRQQRYAINRGEWRETVCGTASPIFDASGQACAAIGISGPATRLTLGRLNELASFVVKAANSVSLALGYTPPRSTRHKGLRSARPR